MKQFFALAGLLAVMSVSAQQQPQRKLEAPRAKQEMRKDKKFDHQGQKRERRSPEQFLKQFDQYGLSSVQKQKLKDLHESKSREFQKDREKQQKQFAKAKEQHRKEFEKRRAEYDKKIEKILDKKQFAQYKQDREKRLMKKDAFQKDHRLKQDKKMRVHG